MLKLVQQPTGNTCTSACLSMITEINIDKVIADFHERWRQRETNPSEYLSSAGVNHEVNSDVYGNVLEWGFAFILTVPSLNIDGGLHHIVIDMTGDKEVVLDPNNGKEGKRFYVGWSDEDGGLKVKLHAWMVDIKIL